jgi:hypothetical protein
MAADGEAFVVAALSGEQVVIHTFLLLYIRCFKAD